MADNFEKLEVGEIKDSGSRRQFDSGAVRDLAEGKGRMDLMPLLEIAKYIRFITDNSDYYSYVDCPTKEDMERCMYENSAEFLSKGLSESIYNIIYFFVQYHYQGSLESALLDLAIQYEEGAKKYAERNWEKGIPCHCYIDSALRHGTKYLRGDTDEPHFRAFLWNLFGLLWTVNHKPELVDLPYNIKITTENY